MTFETRYFLLATIGIMLLSYGSHGELIEVPKNQVLSSENDTAVLRCSSNYTGRKLSWYAKEEVYNGYYVDQRPEAPPYISVERMANGNSYLEISFSDYAAQTYLCKEPGTLMNATAEVICIKSDLICNDTSTKDVVSLTCSIDFRGNWAPTMEWKEQNSHDEKVLSVNITTVPNQRVTSALVAKVPEDSRNYTCTAKFDFRGKPPNTTAANVPKYNRSWTLPVFIKPDKMIPDSVVKSGATVAVVTLVASAAVVTSAAVALGIACFCYQKAKENKTRKRTAESESTKFIHRSA